jgi:transcriptional regulator with XRE-family HTH domain
MTLGEYIKAYREEHDLSQRQFAIQCDLSNGYVSMLENGKNHHTGKPVVPTVMQLKKLADGMHITMQELMDAIDDMPVALEPFVSQMPTGLAGEHLDELEREIMTVVRTLSREQKTRALSYVRFLAQEGS